MGRSSVHVLAAGHQGIFNQGLKILFWAKK